MNPEDFNYFRSKVSKFISGSKSGLLFGGLGKPKNTKFPQFIPKRSVPSLVLNAPTTSQDDVDVAKGAIPSLGRVTLNLEVINNNLSRIKEIIANDYKETQETNKKEIDDYRKRIANRGRILGKRELGDKKTDLFVGVKKYIGSFFSGTGGAIRALASYNFLQALAAGDPVKAIQSLLGIGITYLPAIGGAIGGTIAGSLISKLFGGGGRAAAGAAAQGAGAAASAGRLGGMARFGGRAALVGGGLALASSIFNRPEEDTQQQRLEDLTQQQKGLVDPQKLVPVPQDDLKKFENLNKRFEEALDFLLKKQKEQPTQQPTTTGGGGGGPGPGSAGPVISSSPGEANLAAFISTLESSQLQDQADVLQSMVNRAGQNYSGYGGLFGQLTAKEQYSPLSAAIYGTSGDPAAARAYGDVAAKLGNTPQERIEKLQQIISQPDALSQLQTLFGRGNPQNALALLQDFYSGGSLSKESQRFIKGRTNFGARSGVGGATGAGQMRRSSNTFGAAGANVAPSLLSGLSPSAPSLPSPQAAAPTARVTLSPPPPSQPNVNILPMPIGGSAGTPTSDAVEGNDIVPAINTTYSENFLALYSKLMYQIV